MNIKKSLTSIAIALIFVMFIGYGIEVFNDSPEHNEFCPDVYQINNENDCVNKGGLWGVEGGLRVPKQVNDEEINDYCYQPKSCYDNYESAQNKHDKIVFIVSIVVGLLVIIGGILIDRDSISTGLLGGAVLLLLYGTVRYWRHANDTLKFILLGVALAVLIWIAYKKLDKK
jgi:hypothetical protein